MARVPCLIMTPHSSGHIPFNILADMLGEAVYDTEAVKERLEYLFVEGDPYTDALFYTEEATHVHAQISRFVVDLNRSRDSGGLNGVIKITDFGGNPLYQNNFRFSEKRIGERLSRFYDPYHNTLDRMLAKPDIMFFIDGHSMTPVGPVIGPDSGRPRPAFTIMTGGDENGNPHSEAEHISMPARLALEVQELLWLHFKDLIADSDVPQEILINAPFSRGGTIARLSDPNYKGKKLGFGIEFNRALYLEENDKDPIKGRISRLNKCYQAFMRGCADAIIRHKS